ncbi:MAG TPA: helix-turn-helix transcriptional regulator [Chitinophagaceae bacterium]|nr:helix-turn-helix transcriptional regulator [Chitinophagaceae bacterium]
MHHIKIRFIIDACHHTRIPCFNRIGLPRFSCRRVISHSANINFTSGFTLTEVSKLANMTDVSFSHFFKARTGITFMDSLMEMRLGHASRLLIDTTKSVAEVAYNCGFNNISNFNRLFKKKKGCTPKEFRENYSYGSRVFI